MSSELQYRRMDESGCTFALRRASDHVTSTTSSIDIDILGDSSNDPELWNDGLGVQHFMIRAVHPSEEDYAGVYDESQQSRVVRRLGRADNGSMKVRDRTALTGAKREQNGSKLMKYS